MIVEFFKSMFLIFIAEMGDKTQILAMAFATQFMIKEVLLGVCLGSLLNHGIAVVLGAYLSHIIPQDAVQIAAGFLFIGFGLLSLKADEEDEEERAKKDLSPILTVALAFFIGELGDKTQLAAITLASDASFPLFILLGTVSGMVLTSGVGILIGIKIGDRIPEFTMKIASASIFLIFGIEKLYSSIPQNYLTTMNILIFFASLSISIYFILKPTLELRKYKRNTALKETVLNLYEYIHEIKESSNKICLGEDVCGRCQGKDCIIGYTKNVIDDAIENRKNHNKEDWAAFSQSLSNKDFDKNKVIDSLSMIIVCLLKDREHCYILNPAINKARQMVEYVLFKQKVKYGGNKREYFQMLRKVDKDLARKVINRVEYLTEEIS